ncbi:MAG TPA: hypothetical protein VFD05_02960 [Bacilli bacterium]|nr:hypothetical protein [Bacilli bacterium]
MKRNKKIILLPLLALLLAGCDFGSRQQSSDNTKGSTPIPGESSTVTSEGDESSVVTSEETPVTSDVTESSISIPSEDSTPTPDPDPSVEDADVLVLTSLLKLAQTDLSLVTSLDIGLDIDFTVDYREFDIDQNEAIVPSETIIGEGALVGGLKVADFNTEAPKAQANLLLDVALDDDDANPLLYADGELAAYYKEEWLYTLTDIAYSGPLAEMIFDESMSIPNGVEKLKTEIGPFDLDDFTSEDEMPDFSEIELAEILELWELILGTAVVEKVGENTAVTYEVEVDALIAVALLFVMEMDEELSEEEIDAFLDQIEELVHKLFALEHAIITFMINPNEELVGLKLDFDFALIVPDGDILIDEGFDPQDYPRTEVDLQLIAEISLGLNTPVTVEYPSDLETYIDDPIFD